MLVLLIGKEAGEASEGTDHAEAPSLSNTQLWHRVPHAAEKTAGTNKGRIFTCKALTLIYKGIP